MKQTKIIQHLFVSFLFALPLFASAAIPERATISFVPFMLMDTSDKGVYHDLDKVVRETAERGFNCIRLEGGAGLIHDLDGNRRGAINIHAPWGKYSDYRQLFPFGGEGKCDILPRLVELCKACKKYDVHLILSSWYWLHTNWFVDKAINKEIYGIPTEKRFMTFARLWDRILDELKKEGVIDAVAAVELFNESGDLRGIWAREGDKTEEEIASTFRAEHEAAIAFLRERHPEILISCSDYPYPERLDFLPRNMQMLDHHGYFLWSAYRGGLEDMCTKPGDFFRGEVTTRDILESAGYERRRPFIDDLAWVERVRRFADLDPAKIPALEAASEKRLRDFWSHYKNDFEWHAANYRAAMKRFPGVRMMFGEGVSYCTSLDVLWEEKSEKYWEMVEYAMRRHKEIGLWGTVVKTCCGPEDPSWHLCKDRVKKLNDAFLKDDAERVLPLSVYRDKVAGGWLGQIVGVSWGAPTEFKWNDPKKPMPVEMVPQDVKWTRKDCVLGLDNDDLSLDVQFLKVLAEKGVDVSIREAGIAFANQKAPLWCANARGRMNLRMGIAPPDSSHPSFNNCGNDIDYQIESDYSGLVAPGMPQVAVELGEKFGRIMNYGDGVYAGMFVGAMYAEAFFENDVRRVIEKALAVVPPESDVAKVARQMLAWHKDDPKNWEAVYPKIRAMEFRDSNGRIDVRQNLAMILLGLLWGDGNLEDTIVISMRGGLDSDCNPSNAAGILGTMLGAKAFNPKYTANMPKDHKIIDSPYTFFDLVDASEKVASAFVLRTGGKIVETPDGKAFVIPERTVRAPVYEPTWAAEKKTEPLRYVPEERKQILYGVEMDLTKIDYGEWGKWITLQCDFAFCEAGASCDGCSHWTWDVTSDFTRAPDAHGDWVGFTSKGARLVYSAVCNLGHAMFRVSTAKGAKVKTVVTIDGKKFAERVIAGEDGPTLPVAREELKPFVGKRINLMLEILPVAGDNKAEVYLRF